jgi:hypothetical protein
MPESRDTRIKVLACRHAYTGHNRRGDEFTIYEIEASKPDGTPIREKLRSFTSLPIGQEIDVTVRPYNSEQYGRSFTIAPKGKRSSNFAEAINDLTEHQAETDDRLVKLTQRVKELEEQVGQLLSGRPAPPPTPPPESALDEKFGKDAPW